MKMSNNEIDGRDHSELLKEIVKNKLQKNIKIRIGMIWELATRNSQLPNTPWARVAGPCGKLPDHSNLQCAFYKFSVTGYGRLWDRPKCKIPDICIYFGYP